MKGRLRAKPASVLRRGRARSSADAGLARPRSFLHRGGKPAQERRVFSSSSTGRPNGIASWPGFQAAAWRQATKIPWRGFPVRQDGNAARLEWAASLAPGVRHPLLGRSAGAGEWFAGGVGRTALRPWAVEKARSAGCFQRLENFGEGGDAGELGGPREPQGGSRRECGTTER
jgi:hypothetical protein